MWEGDKLEAAFITANHNFYRELIFFKRVSQRHFLQHRSWLHYKGS
jgi:hypothetical protein